MFENQIRIRPQLKPGSGTDPNNQNRPEPDPQPCLEKRLNSTLDQYTKLLPMFFIIVSFMLQKVFCARKAHINAIYGFFVRQTINDKELDHKESLRRVIRGI